MKRFALAATENAPSRNLDATMTSVFHPGGAAITMTIAETALMKSNVNHTLVQLANSNASPDIASEKSSNVMVNGTAWTSVMNLVVGLDSLMEAIALLKNSNAQITFA